MKRIGLIGGLSPESTVHYYQQICREYNRSAGELNFPPILLDSLNLQELVVLFKRNDWDGVAGILLQALGRLEKAGADFAAILANTPHNAYDRLRDVSPLKILTIMDATADALCRDRRRKVALLGTQATMEYGFFQKHFAARGIETLIPDTAGRAELDRIVWEELSHGTVNPSSRETGRTIIQGIERQGAESVVLACTELGMLIQTEDTPLSLYDTTRIHADAILEFALKP